MTYGNHLLLSMDEPDKVNPARGQVNKENDYKLLQSVERKNSVVLGKC